MAESSLGRAFVTIVPKAEGISNQISDIIGGGSDRASQVAGKHISTNIGNGIIKAGKVFTGFAASGAAAIAGIGASISARAFGGGLARAMQIDDAKAKMNQLGMDTKTIMQNVNDSVTGTRYGLNEMAGIAVNFASSGVEAGSNMTNALKSVASVASIAGVDLNHMGAIFNKVSSAGHVTGQVMTQLSYNGINASAALQKHFGKSAEEIEKMVSKGEISFKDFSDAMYKYFGDASKSANATFSGSLANVGAALSRIGAKFADPALSKLREIFAGSGEETTGLIKALNHLSAALDPVVEKFGEFVSKIGDKLLNAIETFNSAMDGGAGIMDAFKQAIATLIPDSIIEKFNALPQPVQTVLGWLGKGTGIIAGVAGGMGVLGGAVGALIPGLGGLIGPLIGSGGAFKLISSVGNTLFGVLGKLMGGTSGLTGVLGKITGPIGIVAALFAGAFTTSESFRNAIIGLVQSIGSALQPVLASLLPTIQQIIPTIMNIVTMIGNVLGPVIEQLTPVISQIVSTVGTLISEVAAALIPLINAIVPVVQGICNKVLPIVTRIVEFVLTGVNGILTGITPIITGIMNFVSTHMSTVVSVVSGTLGAVKSVFTTIWNAAKSIVMGAVNGIKNAINTISSVIGTVRSTFNSVKEAIQRPIEKVRDKVKEIVEKIKSFFHFSVPKPHIPVPRFSISPSGWKIKDLLKGSIPHLSVTWGAKGGIMNTPTLVGAGEAGKEALLPLDPFWKKLDEMKQANKPADIEKVEMLLEKGLAILEYIAETDKTIRWNNREVGRLIHEVI